MARDNQLNSIKYPKNILHFSNRPFLTIHFI